MASKEWHAEYYKNNKEKWVVKDPGKKKLINDRYRAKNRDLINLNKQIWTEENFSKSLFFSIRSRCKRENIDFAIEPSDIVIPDLCPYLKIPFTRIQGSGRVWTNPSVDRIDPTKGYIKGNVEVISMMANAMKQAATKEQLIQFAKSVIEKYGE